MGPAAKINGSQCLNIIANFHYFTLLFVCIVFPLLRGPLLLDCVRQNSIKYNYCTVLNKCSCLNKCTPGLYDEIIPQNRQQWSKMSKNGWITTIMFLWPPSTHQGECQCSQSIYSELYGMLDRYLFWESTFRLGTLAIFWKVQSNLSRMTTLGVKKKWSL